MQKTRNGAFLAIFLMIAIIFSLTAFAKAVAEQNQGQNQEENQQQNQEQNQGEEIMNQEQNQEREQGQNEVGTFTEKNQKGQINAQEHRSVVANFVQSLLNAASSTSGEIGQQVRLIARQQNESASTTIQAMEMVQTRNKIKTFLFGSDYKNLGALRSETVQTRNRIEQLNRTMTSIQNASDTVQIQAQIQTLEQEQTKIESFIKAQEGKFSLFGWLVKLFNR